MANTPTAPQVLEPVFTTIPATLTDQPFWVLWRLIERHGKATKIPFQTTGSPAKSNDPATWTTFEKVRAAYHRGRGHWSGIGIMLEGSELVGIDLDDKDGTGTLLEAESAPTTYLTEILMALDTYAEVSPGGKGVRILARGTVPRSGRKGPVELYASGSPRFLTITGRKLPGARETIEERTEALGEFCKKVFGSAVAPTALGGSLGDKRLALNRGDLSFYGGDHSAADLALVNLLLRQTSGDRGETDRLFRESGLMRPKWDERRSADGRTYGQRTIDKALESYHRAPASRSEGGAALGALLDFHRTDAGNAERLIAHCGQDLRYVTGLGWRVWDGKRWADGELGVIARARTAMRALHEEAGILRQAAQRAQDTEVRQQLVASAEALTAFALRSESTQALTALVNQAKTFDALVCTPEMFDLKPWRVGFRNGVWDRGEWREHRRDDYMERLLPHDYRPRVDRTEWELLLERMTGGDTALARTLQEVAGYALSGASTLRALPWLYGPPGTGKSTFCELLRTLLGPLGCVLDTSHLTGERERERLGSSVRGKRAVLMPEIGACRLSVQILNMLSGGDGIVGRELYARQSYTVHPTWALLAVSNNPPTFSDTYDAALKSRVIALPLVRRLDAGSPLRFTGGGRLEEARSNPNSPLVAGFMAWAVDGLSAIYKSQSIYRAPVVETHTRRFWTEADPLAEFWDGLDPLALERGMPASALHQAYLSWREAEQVPGRPLHGKSFAAACRAAGLEQQRTRHGGVWHGSVNYSSSESEACRNVGKYLHLEKFPEAGEIEKVSQNGGDSYIPTRISDDLEEIYL